MIEYLYQWMKNLAFYMVVITAALQLIPGENYKKYVRFFAGLILILMLAEPISRIFGLTVLQEQTYLTETRRMEEVIQDFNEHLVGETYHGE